MHPTEGITEGTAPNRYLLSPPFLAVFRQKKWIFRASTARLAKPFGGEDNLPSVVLTHPWSGGQSVPHLLDVHFSISEMGIHVILLPPQQ